MVGKTHTDFIPGLAGNLLCFLCVLSASALSFLFLSYSCRSASTGSNFDARSAGT